MPDDVEVRQGLTLDVLVHPSLKGAHAYIAGALKLQGEFRCTVDLNAGDEITVTMCDADGVVIAQGTCVATYPRFREITDRGDIIGTERVNQAKLI